MPSFSLMYSLSWRKWGESLPVLNKDLFEDVPVLAGCCNHQGAPSEGSGFAVQLLYHGSSAQSTPSSAFTEAPSPTSLTLQPRGLQGNPQMEILYDQGKDKAASRGKPEQDKEHHEPPVVRGFLGAGVCGVSPRKEINTASRAPHEEV